MFPLILTLKSTPPNFLRLCGKLPPEIILLRI